MDGSKSKTRNGDEISVSNNIKCESDSGNVNIKSSDQYVGDSASTSISLGLSTLNDRTGHHFDNNGENEKTSKEMFDNESDVFSCFVNDKLSANGFDNKTNKIKQIIEDTLSTDSKQTVMEILDQVNHLSTTEKLLLYLKLPTGKNQSVDPLRQPLNPLGSRFEIHQTITWIKTHLEEDQDVSLPKQDVYDEYIAYCNNNSMKPLSTADFGKVMKQVFPSVRPRRLGTRGNSRYCYAGMRKRISLQVPLLPDLGENLPKPNDNRSSEDEVLSAAGSLVREWAEKLLCVKFDSLQDLACHLVENTCVDSRSVAAFTLLSALEPCKKPVGKETISPLLLPGRQTSKHREAQIQLQRKLQEREVLREQKRKLQSQQQLTGHKSQTADKSRSKRAKLSQQNSIEEKDSTNRPAKQDQSLADEPTKYSTQENEALPPSTERFVPFWQESTNCDTKRVETTSQLDVPSGFNQTQNGQKEFVDYSTISLGSASADGKVIGGGGLEQSIQTTKTSHNTKVSVFQDPITKFQVSNEYFGNPSSVHKMPQISHNSSKPTLKTRHMSVDFEPSVSASFSGRHSSMSNRTDVCDNFRINEVEAKVGQERSNLRFYLERLPVKKSPNVSPIQDSNAELSPTVFESQSPCFSTNSVQSPLPTGNSGASSAISSPQSVGKVAIPRLTKPRKETTANLIIFPPSPIVTQSSNNKYKRIQPKIDPTVKEEDRMKLKPVEMGKEGSAFIPPKILSKKMAIKHRTNLNTISNGKSLINKKQKTTKVTRDSNIPSNTNKCISSSSNVVGKQTTTKCSSSNGPTPSKMSGSNRVIPPRVRNEVSIGSLDKDALDDYLHGGGNSQEQEEELMQYFQQNSDDSNKSRTPETMTETLTPDNVTGKSDQLSQLRLLLERNLTSTRRPATAAIVTSSSKAMATEETDDYLPSPRSASQSLSILSQRSQLAHRKPNLVLPSVGSSGGYSGSRRRVSFETSTIDHSVPKSPNTRRRIFSFTPISPGPHSPLGRIPSKPSSANASPFVSPRNTPVPRSRNNSGQTNVQNSYLASYLNNCSNPGRGQPSSQMLNAGVINGGMSNLNGCQNLNVLQRHQNVDTAFAGQNSNVGGSITNSLTNLVATRALSQTITNSNTKLDSFGNMHQNSKFQRSNSVNSELTSRYPRMKPQIVPLSINTSNSNYIKYTQTQADTDSNMFVIPSDSQKRNYTMSASAPQSPMFQYSQNSNPFELKLRANSFEGPRTNALMEEMLCGKTRRESPSDQFMGASSNISLLNTKNSSAIIDELEASSVLIGNMEPLTIDNNQCDESVDQSTTPLVLNTLHKDQLSNEVSQFFTEDNLFQKNIPNFAQMQYRSQSVPLHRMASALVSPLSSRNAFNFASTANSMAPTPVSEYNTNSMAPTPVPSEYQDFGSDILLDPEQTVDGGLDSENLNRIFNLLDDAQDKTQMCVDMNENEAQIKVETGNQNGLSLAEQDVLIVQNLIENNHSLDLNLELSNKEKIEQNYDSMAQNNNLIEGMSNSVATRNQLTVNLNESQQFDEAMGSLQPSPSYVDNSLPYKSTFEYVADGSYRTLLFNAMNIRTSSNENNFGARRNISLLLEPSYFADNLNGGLPDCDNVGQLEQQVDKL